MAETVAPKKFQLVGGEICLDFCNTVGGKREGIARENLHSYDDLLSWYEQAALIEPTQAEALHQAALSRPQEAATALVRAIRLRESIYNILFAVARSKPPKAEDVQNLNSELASSLGRLRLTRQKGAAGFQWTWAAGDIGFDHPLGPIARSAADLLTHPDLLARIHQCKGDNCGWLFLDASKNHSRCWCDMRDCGNRAKVRRHRDRRAKDAG
jgi:predicted RNA-binding Zn ribbon-like protein